MLAAPGFGSGFVRPFVGTASGRSGRQGTDPCVIPGTAARPACGRLDSLEPIAVQLGMTFGKDGVYPEDFGVDTGHRCHLSVLLRGQLVKTHGRFAMSVCQLANSDFELAG